MTTAASIPAKYLVPFAQNDTAKVEIPVTTTDTTRASQSLGFPPRTMLPPEASGVPPQGEDFNGAMNQIARAAWWMLQGNGFPYDSTFANDTNIGGYAKGATLPRSDYFGTWISGADNNTTNPEATDGSAANWYPLSSYGIQAISGLTGGSLTLTPLQAAHGVLVFTGTLTSAQTIVMPAWQRLWTLVNNTTGNFGLSIQAPGGTAVSVLQSSAMVVYGDGTNAFTAVGGRSGPTPAAFDSSTAYATTSWVNSRGWGGGGVQQLSATTTLTSSAYGKLVELINSTAITVTLPTTTSALGTSSILVHNVGSANATVQTQGTDKIRLNNVTGVTSFVVKPGDWAFITVESNISGAGVYNAMGSATLQYSSNFTSSLALSGYAYSASGSIDQWISVNVTAANTDTTVTWPIQFPSNVLSVSVTPNGSGTNGYGSVTSALGPSGRISITIRSSQTGSTLVRAIGN